MLEQLADTLAQKGVRYVDGDIVADDSYFAFQRYGDGWSQDDLVWADGAPVSALTINDNVIFVNILPADRAGDRVAASVFGVAGQTLRFINIRTRRIVSRNETRGKCEEKGESAEKRQFPT